ncbi:substrate-binding domain-containing protein [Kordiimonas sp.]|uniref:substrate-binding domain-containing protein n=1 Tax=Kordiimonas sp. TaxID=1970157 RepID=UPI003A8D5F89|eukprot:GFYU01012641.1.p1 GENE.GFYU01012641.1~~GFYU01012641.1.p1  ORF type:complete len:357 (+),score=9.67 GFYU01012641.1:34-1104(+)
MKKFAFVAAVAGAALFASSGAQAQSRDQIRIVGSSTVFPFSTAVAEEFGRTSTFKTPIVESTGSGGGLKLFCSGIGTNHPDITNASRRIKQSEVDLCAKNGVTNVVEVKIGFDGIVLAADKSAPDMTISLRELYLALAAKVPAPGTEGGAGNMIDNPYKTWADVNASLPNRPIVVLGPPPTSGTRDAFNELAIEAGCKTFEGMKALKSSDGNAYKAYCRGIREDGAYVEAGENDNLIVQKLQANNEAIGVFGFSFLDQNADAIKAYPVGEGADAVEPTFEAISEGSYSISRSLYFYVKKAHVDVVPGIREYLGEFTSDKAWGDFGYLTDRGLIPLSEEERQKFADDAAALTNLSLD